MEPIHSFNRYEPDNFPPVVRGHMEEIIDCFDKMKNRRGKMREDFKQQMLLTMAFKLQRLLKIIHRNDDKIDDMYARLKEKQNSIDELMRKGKHALDLKEMEQNLDAGLEKLQSLKEIVTKLKKDGQAEAQEQAPEE